MSQRCIEGETFTEVVSGPPYLCVRPADPPLRDTPLLESGRGERWAQDSLCPGPGLPHRNETPGRLQPAWAAQIHIMPMPIIPIPNIPIIIGLAIPIWDWSCWASTFWCAWRSAGDWKITPHCPQIWSFGSIE